jgi:hypothetical protein
MLNVEQNSAIIDVISVQDVPEGRMRRFEVNEKRNNDCQY